MNKELKDRIQKRKIAYIYLLHRMFESNPAMLVKIMKIPEVTVEDIKDWDADYKEAVYQTIQEEDEKGVQLKDPTAVPSIKSIKEKVLRRCDSLINMTEDPSKLAQVYKILSEFEVADDKKEKSVLDAINESVKPLTPKQKQTITMLEKMRQENLAGGAPKRGRGRPKKAEVEEPLIGNPDDDSLDENEENRVEE